MPSWPPASTFGEERSFPSTNEPPRNRPFRLFRVLTPCSRKLGWRHTQRREPSPLGSRRASDSSPDRTLRGATIVVLQAVVHEIEEPSWCTRFRTSQRHLAPYTLLAGHFLNFMKYLNFCFFGSHRRGQSSGTPSQIFCCPISSFFLVIMRAGCVSSMSTA